MINGVLFNEKIFNIFSNDKNKNFHFFIIINSYNKFNQYNQTSLIGNEIYSENKLITFIESINKYLILEKYIKLEGKPVMGIFYSSLAPKLITYIRNYEIKYKISIYFITISTNNKKIEKINNSNTFIEFPSQNLLKEQNISQNYFYNFYYPYLINKENNKTNSICNFFIVNGSDPEKFYILFKKYLNLTKFQNEGFILFNAWNNYQDNSYLEPNKELGFAYLNYLSKTIFNINNQVIYDLEKLKNKCLIAIQVHIFYKDLIEEIINKTNNIPVKFDLLITVNSPEIYIYLKNYIIKFSKANDYEILIVENKGRDILPFLSQIKFKFKFYKYLCHIHTKKSLTAPEIGFLWRNYLFNNLLGNNNIISEILNDFETNKKLGFIFPETFYGIIRQFYVLTEGTKKWIYFLFSKLFPNYLIGKLSNFPAGNMFWAKISAIFQIFTYDFNEFFPKEGDQTNDTIMHGIERIWLYLVKFNKYYYKTIFKFYI